jgi:hypothetical protein
MLLMTILSAQSLSPLPARVELSRTARGTRTALRCVHTAQCTSDRRGYGTADKVVEVWHLKATRCAVATRLLSLS